MENYKTLIMILAALIISSFFFVQNFSSLITNINATRLKIQNKRLVLANEIEGLDDVLSSSQNYSVSPGSLEKSDIKNGTNFSAEFSKPTIAFNPSFNLSLGEQLYLRVKKEQQTKKSEDQKLKDLRVLNFVPPWQFLFVTGLGVFIIRLLNRGADFICDIGSANPLKAMTALLIIFVVISVVVYWL